MTDGNTSKVGSASVYEAKDQQAPEQPNTVNPNPEYDQGKTNAHNPTDSKDERSIANRLEAESKHSSDADNKSEEDRARAIDPTLPAKLHGNKPSKGAVIDAEIEAEEAKMHKSGSGPAAAN